MNTLFDKIWDAHVVTTVEDGPTQLYIDRLYCHEVTSPQAFAGLRARGIKCFRPEKIYCMPDHNTPTHDQDKPIEDPVSKTQVDTLTKNAKDFGLTHFGMMDKRNGIIHVVGPERGLTLPGMTIVCGDSHTSTHGAMGAVAFGIGTYIANDTCEEPLNIVMKTTACNGMDVAKISDTPGKEMCKNADYVDYLTRCIRWRLEHDR